MENSTVVRSGSQGVGRFQKFVLFLLAVLGLAAGFIWSTMNADMVKTWRATDFQNTTRADLFAKMPGEFIPDSWYGLDEWIDRSGLIGRSLLVFHDPEDESETFEYDGTSYPNHPITDAMIAYHLTLPLVGYFDIYTEWLPRDDD